MLNSINEKRFESIFIKILNKRILPFIAEHVFDIVDNKNFTHYYKDEVFEGINYVRPIFNITLYDFIIISLIIDELQNKEFVTEMYLDIIPISINTFLRWLPSYLLDRNLLFHVNVEDPDTKEKNTIVFYAMILIDYNKIMNDCKKLLENK